MDYITDLVLFRKNDEYISEDDIFEVSPYVASEVLSGKEQFIQAANIYEFGIIMVKMSTRQRPVKICTGLHGPSFKTYKLIKILKENNSNYANKKYIDLEYEKRSSVKNQPFTLLEGKSKFSV
ncbi:hypothetical protein C2G38_2169299 [Gigaspora rosea]|uniref:Protein kinase domain-containing protein n=1 Tax=Gigaspora rosea TaxID=44941 RepID=A0A397VQV2_9GLOM|nr:hypothetical protein C2G38_2169299 [Gigaspora rosea]